MILTNYDGLESGFILTEYEAPPIGSFKEEVENVKICFWRHNIITNVGSAIKIYEAQPRHMRNICTILFLSYLRYLSC